MIYELRIYYTLPGRPADLNARFVNHTLKLWENKFKFRPVGFWTPLIGDSNNDLYYILEWKSLGDREKNGMPSSPIPNGWQYAPKRRKMANWSHTLPT